VEVCLLHRAVQPSRFLSEFTAIDCAWPFRLSSVLFASAERRATGW